MARGLHLVGEAEWEWCEIPSALADDEHQFGQMSDDERPAASLLDVLARHARLISPSSEVYLCSNSAGGRWGGFYQRTARTIVLKSCTWNPPWMLRILAHELMHAVFANLPTGHIDVLRSSCDAAANWGDGYFDDFEERACRLFESWVMSIFDCGLMHMRMLNTLTVQAVLDEVYAGKWAYPPPPPPPPPTGLRKVLAWI